jgi:hypothetical protein
MAQPARSPAADRQAKPARAFDPLTQGATPGSPITVACNTPAAKGRAAFPVFGTVALSNGAGIKGRVADVPVASREPFARAAATYQPQGD